MSGTYQYPYENPPYDSYERKKAWDDHCCRIDEVFRSQMMFSRHGRIAITDTMIAEHVLKHTECDVQTENLAPGPQLFRSHNAHNFAVARPSGTNKRPSPTPSFKKSKAEELLKQHGSPPHVRVTAGGRIVPNDLPQLGSPRFAPTPVYHHPRSGRMVHAVPNGLAPSQFPNGYITINGNTGEMLQWIDGHFEKVQRNGFGQMMYRIPPPNMGPPPPVSCALITRSESHQLTTEQQAFLPPYLQSGPLSLGAPRPPSFTPVVPEDIDDQIAAADAEYKRLEQEDKEFKRHEVKAREKGCTPALCAEMVRQKREYVNWLNAIRENKKALEQLRDGGKPPLASGTNINTGPSMPTMPSAAMYNMGGYDGAGGVVPGLPMPMYGPGAPSGMYPLPSVAHGVVPWSNNFSQTETPAGPALQRGDGQHHSSQGVVESPASEPSPSSRAQGRRSHAVEIRDPNEAHYNLGPEYPVYRKTQSVSGEHPSNLNPASPSYEPGKPYPLTEGSPPHFVVPAPTPIETPNPPPAELAKHWVFSQQKVHSQHHSHMLANLNMHEHGRVPMSMINNVNGKANGNNVGTGGATQHGHGLGHGNEGLLGGRHVDVSTTFAVSVS
jgi:hypothetical protein